MFFTESLYYLTLGAISLFAVISIHLKKRKRYEDILGTAQYFVILFLCLCIFSTIEISLFQGIAPMQILIYELEMVVILCLFTYFYFVYYRKTSESILFLIYLAIVLLTSHITISSAVLSFIPGTIVAGFISLLIVIFIKNFNEYKKRAYLVLGMMLYFYIALIVYNIIFIAIIALILVFSISLLGHRSVYGRFLTLFHTMRTNLTPSFINKNSIQYGKRFKRPLFWLAEIRITQIAKKEKKEKKKIKTFLEDFFKKKNIYRLKMNINRDLFRLTFIIKTKTEKDCIIKGNKVLANLKSVFEGLDGNLNYRPVTPKYIYKKEKWYLIKLPKAPYIQQIDLINRLCTLFGEDRHKIKLLIMWQKAPQKKILQTRAKIIAMKHKDKTEKSTYLKMWREELFKVRIYISYKVLEFDPESLNEEILAMKGRVKSLEIPARNVNKQAKIRRTLCGARADFYKGNLYNGKYMTPISLDFTLSEKLPLFAPVGLKRQIINWEQHKKSLNSFPIGKWVDENGRKRETLMYCTVDDFVQGGLIIGEIGSGKSYLMGYIIKSITTMNPEVGILILNFKREHEENLYSAQKIYRFGKNLTLPYFPPVEKEKLNETIVNLSKAIMGALGYEEEGVYAFKNVLETHIKTYNKPPESIIELLELTKLFFTREGYTYDDKFRAKITSSLNTRISAQLSKALEDTLSLHGEIQWYKDWKAGKIIQIDLTNCNEWEQRLIAILILQTIKSLTPDKGISGLKNLIIIDEAHRMIAKQTSPGKHKSDDYIACEQIEKIFSVIFSEFRDRGISFLLADQRADHLLDSAIKIPVLKFLLRQDFSSVERFTKDPHRLELISNLADRYCILKKGKSGEFFSFITMDYIPDKFENDYFYVKASLEQYNIQNNVEIFNNHIKKVVCPKCEMIIELDNGKCPNCKASLTFGKTIHL